MNWYLAGVAPLVIGGVYRATGLIHPAILAYHATCAIAIYLSRERIRPFFRRERGLAAWSAGASLLFVTAVALTPLFVDLPSYRVDFYKVLMPRGAGSRGMLFALFAAYSMLVHAPIEEIFWRGAVMDPGGSRPLAAIGGNAAFFYFVHAVPMSMILGRTGLLFALPTAAAGAAWAFVAIRSRSLWPGLISHWAVDAAILIGMWFYFIR